MTWADVAVPHIGHRASLKDAWSLRCHDCDVTLVIHREPAARVTTSGPPPYRRPDPARAASPETVARLAAEARANLAHAKKLKRSAEA